MLQSRSEKVPNGRHIIVLVLGTSSFARTLLLQFLQAGEVPSPEFVAAKCFVPSENFTDDVLASKTLVVVDFCEGYHVVSRQHTQTPMKAAQAKKQGRVS